jgi:hypothetical protein
MGFWIFSYEFLFTTARIAPFDMLLSLRPDMCYILCTDGFPVFHEYDADGTIRTRVRHAALALFLTPCTCMVQWRRRIGRLVGKLYIALCLKFSIDSDESVQPSWDFVFISSIEKDLKIF